MFCNNYEQYDGVALAAHLRSAEVTPLELMDAAIDRARTRALPLNAICFPRFSDSIARARATPLQGTFGGIPFLLKDSGLASPLIPTGAGSQLFKGTETSISSTLAKRFERAGLIPFARTTVPELCMAPTTEALANGGPTLNPWDQTLSPGGSSGGAAVAVATGVVPIAHASDGGGSIRIPASCCGVFGLKPSRGLIPCGPARGEGWGGLATDGVISRTVRDTAAALDEIAGYEPGAPYAAPSKPHSFLETLNAPFERPLRIAKWSDAFNGLPVDQACLDAVRFAEEALIGMGHEVTPVPPPSLDYGMFLTSLIDVLATNAAVTIDSFVKGAPRHKWDHLLEPAILDAYRLGQALPAFSYVNAINFFHRCSRVITEFMQGFDLVLTPTLTRPPVKLGELSMAEDFKTFRRKVSGYTPFLAVINASGHPASSIPLYWTENSIPIGVQLIGHFGDEATLLKTSAALEAIHPWAHRYGALHRDFTHQPR